MIELDMSEAANVQDVQNVQSIVCVISLCDLPT